jgi:putative restriction endonuclease
VRTLCEIHDHLTAQQLGEGFIVDSQRYPLVNPRRGIFKPADNRWLREAFENQVPIIYFLGIAPGRYQAILPAFIGGWDRSSKRAHMGWGQE